MCPVNNNEQPFFLYLNWTIPPTPLIVPEDSKAPYRNLGWSRENDVAYAGMISRVDRDMGDIMNLLKELNIDDNTLVIFTSDNGPEYAGRSGNFFNSNGPFQGFKRDLYEGGIHMPFIARWPSKIEAGTQSEHIIAFWDFLPTVCELVGIEPSDKTIDGVSYLPTLLGNAAKQKEPEYLYWEINEKKGPIQAIRKGKWKAIKFYQKPVALYDLSKDSAEKNDIAANHTEIVQEMVQLFSTVRTENTEFPMVPIKKKERR
jgi:arylsulfatase A-like enzyme